MTVRMLPDKEINKILYSLPVVRQEVRGVAEEIKREAQQRLAMHRDRGHAKVVIEQAEKAAFYVEMIDEAAVSIEFGATNVRAGRFVPGLYIIHSAAENVKAGWLSYAYYRRHKKRKKDR